MHTLRRSNPNKERSWGLIRLAMANNESKGSGDHGNRDDRAGKGKASPNVPQSRGIFGMVMIILLVALLYAFFSQANRTESITLAEFENLWNSGLIEPKSVEIRGSEVVATRLPGPDSENESIVRIDLNMYTGEYIATEVSKITGNTVHSRKPSQVWPVVLTFGPLILIVLVLWFFISRGLRNAGGGGGMLGNFGKSRHRVLGKEMTGVTFNDVAGVDEAKDEVHEIIEFLKNPKRFAKLGGRIPRGVLLTGPPGCGKTLLAKAIAGEADVPFFTISGSDFVEMFVGVGASRVRDLFKQAKETAPCIIFLDEIDAVGRKRGGGFSSGGHDEREQTLNAILVEMDGFAPADGVIVIAATNRPDVLDAALIRPGRFDRTISVDLPDVVGRAEILRVHAKRIKLGPDADLERLARATPMFSGADLAAIINEAAIAATMAEKDFVEQEDLEEARDKVRFGRAKKSRKREDDDNRRTAYHEAGHAVLQALLDHADPLHKVTIIPRGQSLGATFSLPTKDRTGIGLKWITDTMQVLCAGRISEKRATDDIDSGAAMDIQYITELARHMVLEWGMSERLGFVRYAGSDTREFFMPEKEYSDDTARIVDEEVKSIISGAYARATKLVDESWDKIDRVANALIKHETLDAEDVHALMRGETLDKPTVADLLKAEAKKDESESSSPAPKAAEDPETPPDALPSPA